MTKEEKKVSERLGMRIKELRAEQDMSQATLASESNLEKSNLSRIEAGNTNPSLSTLLKISKGLKVTLSHLVDISLK